MPRHYLLSRTLDPLLGVFTGFLAYYLHETNPRTAPPPGHTLSDLVRWQWGENARLRDQAAAANAANEEAELDAVRRELEEAPAQLSHAAAGATGAAQSAAKVAAAHAAAAAPPKNSSAAQKDAGDRAAAAASTADAMTPASTLSSKKERPAMSDKAV